MTLREIAQTLPNQAYSQQCQQDQLNFRWKDFSFRTHHLYLSTQRNPGRKPTVPCRQFYLECLGLQAVLLKFHNGLTYSKWKRSKSSSENHGVGASHLRSNRNHGISPLEFSIHWQNARLENDKACPLQTDSLSVGGPLFLALHSGSSHPLPLSKKESKWTRSPLQLWARDFSKGPHRL